MDIQDIIKHSSEQLLTQHVTATDIAIRWLECVEDIQTLIDNVPDYFDGIDHIIAVQNPSLLICYQIGQLPATGVYQTSMTSADAGFGRIVVYGFQGDVLQPMFRKLCALLEARHPSRFNMAAM